MTSAAGLSIAAACLRGHALMGHELLTSQVLALCVVQQVSSMWMCSLQGLAGAVCFWLDTLDPEHAAFPGYEL